MFRIRIANKDFSATNDADLPSEETARREALRGALEIGTEEVCGGKPFFGAEVSIERDGEPVERLVIALGASPLV